MRCLLIMSFLLGLIIFSFESGDATPFTPLEWQCTVENEKLFAAQFIGQRKHTSWVRDRNRNFIDDIIDVRIKRKVDKFDIIVDLNNFLTVDEIKKKFDGYHLKYIGKMITFILVNNVKAENLPMIAKMDQVAMIEIQQDFQPALDISARAVQAKACESCPYSSQTAEDAGLTGSGINIAIIDTGVDDVDHKQFKDKFVAGFDATKFEDVDHDGVDDGPSPTPDEPADGTTNPDDDWEKYGSHGHGTHVAGIALGGGVGGSDCRTPDHEAKNCAGVAPGAGLVDIKVCSMKECDDYIDCAVATCESLDMIEALDWLGLNFNKDSIKVRVANISLSYATGEDESGDIIWDDDGTSGIAQQVNYLSTLGLVMVVAHGNSSWPKYEPGDRVTRSPGSASFALTVSGTRDKRTVTRSDDEEWERPPIMNGYLVGPRCDFEQAYDILALKPDISAPAEEIWSAKYDTPNEYWEHSGTSMAAPHVSGAAAIILGANSEMNPGSVKEALIQSADNNQNTSAFTNMYPNWDKAFGWGMLNVRAAIDLVAATDVGFPSCSGSPSNPGSPCALSGDLPSYNNSQDISTAAPIQVGVANEIQVKVKNYSDTNQAEVLVNFGVYVFAVGNNEFFHIGSQREIIDAGSTKIVTHTWTPEAADHQCIQVSIDYGRDTNFDNNVTQRNLQVAPSHFTMRVENPFPVPAKFLVQPSSQREGWDCRVDETETKFELHPYLDAPKIVQIKFDAPEDAKPGERCDCDVAVFAMPKGATARIEIGGVTVHTFVPKPCRIIGWIRDEQEHPISGAKVILSTARKRIEAESDKYGFVSFEGIPYRPQKITVISDKYGDQSTKEQVPLYCGAGTFEIIVTQKGLIIETNQRKKDWAWDPQLREGYEYKRKNGL